MAFKKLKWGDSDVQKIVFDGDDKVAKVVYDGNVVWLQSYNVTLKMNGGVTDGSAVVTFENTSTDSLTPPIHQSASCIGYYTAAEDGTKVINTDGTLQASVSGYTDANSKWIRRDYSTSLYAHWQAYSKLAAPTQTGATLTSLTLYNPNNTTVSYYAEGEYKGTIEAYGYATMSNLSGGQAKSIYLAASGWITSDSVTMYSTTIAPQKTAATTVSITISNTNEYQVTLTGVGSGSYTLISGGSQTITGLTAGSSYTAVFSPKYNGGTATVGTKLVAPTAEANYKVASKIKIVNSNAVSADLYKSASSSATSAVLVTTIAAGGTYEYQADSSYPYLQYRNGTLNMTNSSVATLTFLTAGPVISRTNGTSISIKNNNSITATACYGTSSGTYSYTMSDISAGGTGSTTNPASSGLFYGIFHKDGLYVNSAETTSRFAYTYTQSTISNITSQTCYRYPYSGGSWTTISSGATIYEGDQLYWTATAAATYKPKITYNSPTSTLDIDWSTAAGGVYSSTYISAVNNTADIYFVKKTGVASATITYTTTSRTETTVTPTSGAAYTSLVDTNYSWYATAASGYVLDSPSSGSGTLTAAGLSIAPTAHAAGTYTITMPTTTYGSWSQASGVAYEGDYMYRSGNTWTCKIGGSAGSARWTSTLTASATTAQYTYTATAAGDSFFPTASTTAGTATSSRTERSYTITLASAASPSTSYGGAGYWTNSSGTTVTSATGLYSATISKSSNVVTIGGSAYTYNHGTATTGHTYSSYTISGKTSGTVGTGGTTTGTSTYTLTPYAVTITCTYSKSRYLSTNSSATSGSASGTKFDYGTTVYGFATLNDNTAQYTYTPQSSWTLITGRTYRIGSKVVSTSGNSITGAAIRTTNKYAVTMSAGTGVNSVYSSITSTATSGNASGYEYDYGTTVYLFAKMNAGYIIEGGTLISGTAYEANAIYRVTSNYITGTWAYGTINGTPRSGLSLTIGNFSVADHSLWLTNTNNVQVSIYYGTSSSSLSLLKTVAANASTYLFNDPTCGSYYFQLKATNYTDSSIVNVYSPGLLLISGGTGVASVNVLYYNSLDPSSQGTQQSITYSGTEVYADARYNSTYNWTATAASGYIMEASSGSGTVTQNQTTIRPTARALYTYTQSAITGVASQTCYRQAWNESSGWNIISSGAQIVAGDKLYWTATASEGYEVVVDYDSPSNYLTVSDSVRSSSYVHAEVATKVYTWSVPTEFAEYVTLSSTTGPSVTATCIVPAMEVETQVNRDNLGWVMIQPTTAETQWSGWISDGTSTITYIDGSSGYFKYNLSDYQFVKIHSESPSAINYTITYSDTEPEVINYIYSDDDVQGFDITMTGNGKGNISYDGMSGNFYLKSVDGSAIDVNMIKITNSTSGEFYINIYDTGSGTTVASLSADNTETDFNGTDSAEYYIELYNADGGIMSFTLEVWKQEVQTYDYLIDEVPTIDLGTSIEYFGDYSVDGTDYSELYIVYASTYAGGYIASDNRGRTKFYNAKTSTWLTGRTFKFVEEPTDDLADWLSNNATPLNNNN